MSRVSRYEYVCIFEDQWTTDNGCCLFVSSGMMKPTEELCNLKKGDSVIITTKGITREYLVTWVSESAGGKQWYAWVRPII